MFHNTELFPPPLKHVSGLEIETLADYYGQGALGVMYYKVDGYTLDYHPIPRAYDNLIAYLKNEYGELSLTTDSNRSMNSKNFPMRTCIEFRADPNAEITNILLDLVQFYTDWLERKKKQFREKSFTCYATPTRAEKNKTCYLKINDFILEYNAAKTADQTLEITSPQTTFLTKNTDEALHFLFPTDAEWVIKLDYEDLDPKWADAVFFAQYNVSIPIGCVFSLDTKNAFAQQTMFALLDREKEFAADFNESRPSTALLEYEQEMFTRSLELADHFSAEHKILIQHMGARDFLRGIAFEFAMISTSQKHLATLFQVEAAWISEQQRIHSVLALTPNKKNSPNQPATSDIALSLANTLKKSLFSYFVKTTLAEFFKLLHPCEKDILKAINKNVIFDFCKKAVDLANDGKGNAKGHASHFVSHFGVLSFLEKFDDFYNQTFLGFEIPNDASPSDPIGCLTSRFIPPTNIGTARRFIPAVVVELRRPTQGHQSLKDIVEMYTKFKQTHSNLLGVFYQKKEMIQHTLHATLASIHSSTHTVATLRISQPTENSNPVTSIHSPIHADEPTPARRLDTLLNLTQKSNGIHIISLPKISPIDALSIIQNLNPGTAISVPPYHFNDDNLRFLASKLPIGCAFYFYYNRDTPRRMSLVAGALEPGRILYLSGNPTTRLDIIKRVVSKLQRDTILYLGEHTTDTFIKRLRDSFPFQVKTLYLHPQLRDILQYAKNYFPELSIIQHGYLEDSQVPGHPLLPTPLGPYPISYDETNQHLLPNGPKFTSMPPCMTTSGFFQSPKRALEARDVSWVAAKKR